MACSENAGGKGGLRATVTGNASVGVCLYPQVYRLILPASLLEPCRGRARTPERSRGHQGGAGGWGGVPEEGGDPY